MPPNAPARQPDSPASPWRIAIDAIQRLGEGQKRSFGLVMLVVGSLFLIPALGFFLGMAFAKVEVVGTIEQRYYEMTPRFAPADAAQTLASGPLPWKFNVRSSAVLGYRTPDGAAHHVLFRNPRIEIDTFGELDRRIAVPWIELRFPAGELALLKSLPADPNVDLARRCDWCATRFDELMNKVDDPEAFLITSWTGARGTTVPLMLHPWRPDQPFLGDESSVGLSLRGLPAIAMGGMFVLAGMMLALSRTPTPQGPRPRTIGDRIWLAIVVTAPLWVWVFPTAIGWYNPIAAQIVTELTNSPLEALQFFEVVVPEPVPQAAFDSVRSPGPDSVYAPLWSELKFERPQGCCASGVEVDAAAAAQAGAQIEAFDPARKERFLAAAEHLQQQGHHHMDALVTPAWERAPHR